MVLNAISTSFVMLAIMMVGYFSCKVGLLDAERHVGALAGLVTNIAAPCALFSSMTQNFTAESLVAAFGTMGISFVVQVALFALAYGIAVLLKVEKRRLSLFACLSAVPNILFVGLPVVLGLYGQSAIGTYMLFYTSAVGAMWLVAIPVVKRGAGKADKLFCVQTLKLLLCLPILSFFVSAIVVLCNWTVPTFVLSFTDMLSGMMSPLALLFIGMVLYRSGFASIKFDLHTILQLAIKFVLCPLVAYGVAVWCGFDTLSTQLFIIAISMPAAIQPAITAEAEGGDSVYAAAGVSVSTLLSLAAIPIYMMII